jgi:polyhydroxyalkanoate synthesis regulator phasin
MIILKSKRDEIVFKMKLTSKDEFQILSKRVENLEKKIEQLKDQKKRKFKRVKKS